MKLKIYLYEKIYGEKFRKIKLSKDIKMAQKNEKKKDQLFFGNEFFDAIPIKQFSKKGNSLMEKCYMINHQGLHETYRIAYKKDVDLIKSFKVLKNSNFIEYPKLGFGELENYKQNFDLTGGILLIDYGDFNLVNKSITDSNEK